MPNNLSPHNPETEDNEPLNTKNKFRTETLEPKSDCTSKNLTNKNAKTSSQIHTSLHENSIDLGIHSPTNDGFGHKGHPEGLNLEDATQEKWRINYKKCEQSETWERGTIIHQQDREKKYVFDKE